jgi:hypothetical protein
MFICSSRSVLFLEKQDDARAKTIQVKKFARKLSSSGVHVVIRR